MHYSGGACGAGNRIWAGVLLRLNIKLAVELYSSPWRNAVKRKACRLGTALWCDCHGQGGYRHGDEGRFGGAQRSRDRLARTVYLDAFDYFERGFGACGDALERDPRAKFEIPATRARGRAAPVQRL